MRLWLTAWTQAVLTAAVGLGALLIGCTVSGIEYQILVDREFATQPMSETAMFRSGEKFRLRIKPQQDCYAYLLNYGSSGRYTVLFPLPRINGGSNFVRANRTVELPPSGGYQFDGQPGFERLVLCVSRRPHPELEELARSGASECSTAEALLVQLEQANRWDSSLIKTLDQDGAQACLVSRHPDAVLVCRMTLRHEPRRSTSLRFNTTARPEHPRLSVPPSSVSAPGQLCATPPGPASSGPESSDGDGAAALTDRPSTPEAAGTGAVPLADAVRQGLITVTASGDGLSSVRLCVSRRQSPGLRVSVPVGTYFASLGTAQSMISMSEATLDLLTDEKVDIQVPAVCADFDRPQPDERSRFAVGRVSDPRVQRLVQAIERRQPSHVVAQVAIWAVTGDVSRAELNRTLRQTRYVGGVPTQVGPAATDADIAAARALLEEAGLKAGKFRLFR